MSNPLPLTFLLALPLVAAPLRSPTAAEDPYPLPTGSMVLGTTSDRQSLADLLADFAVLADQNISVKSNVLQMLEATEIELMSPVNVPAEELYSFVESLLVQHDFVLAELRREEPRLLAVHWIQDKSSNARRGCRAVSVDELAAYANHPAMMIRTVVDVSPANANAVANGMRHLVNDQRSQGLWPTGSEASLTIDGPAGWVIDIVSTAREIAASHPAPEPEPLKRK